MTKNDIIKEIEDILKFLETDNQTLREKMHINSCSELAKYKCVTARTKIRSLLIKNSMDDAENKLEEMLKR